MTDKLEHRHFNKEDSFHKEPGGSDTCPYCLTRNTVRPLAKHLFAFCDTDDLSEPPINVHDLLEAFLLPVVLEFFKVKWLQEYHADDLRDVLDNVIEDAEKHLVFEHVSEKKTNHDFD